MALASVWICSCRSPASVKIVVTFLRAFSIALACPPVRPPARSLSHQSHRFLTVWESSHMFSDGRLPSGGKQTTTAYTHTHTHTDAHSQNSRVCDWICTSDVRYPCQSRRNESDDQKRRSTLRELQIRLRKKHKTPVIDSLDGLR